MMKTLFVLVAVLACSVLSLKESDVQSFAQAYEKFTFSQNSVKKRSVDDLELNLQFEGKDLTLSLTYNYELTQGITLETPRSFLKGTVQGYTDSIVRLSMEDNFLEGLIMLEGESIYVENIEVNEGHNTVLYKASNMKRDDHESLKSRCKQMEPILIGQDELIASPVSIDSEMPSSFSGKTERAEAPRDCRMAIVADISFYNRYGTNTQSIMVSTINTIEGLYLKQVNTGLPIVYTYVVTNQNDASGLGRPSTNMNTLLSSFSTLVRNRSLPNFPASVCLAHLFTYQDYGGVLGLAYVGSSNPNTIGGICSPQGVNTGVSSFQSGNRESSVIARTVTVAHEIGHNFGSSHDTQHGNPPGNPPECNPSDKYMMFPSVNTGFNAQTFSPCSLYLITETIRQKSTCFTARTSSPTSSPTNSPTSSPTNPPTTRPPTTRPPTNPPTNPPTGDQCATDPRLAGGNYVACSFQPSGLSPCILLCAQQGRPSQCFYFTQSNGQYIFKNAGSSCGSGRICTSTGTCTAPPPTTPPPTRAPTLPPTRSPTISPPPSSTSTPQPRCPSWAPAECPINDCQLTCYYYNYCVLIANRPDGTPCGGSGRCVAGTCRPVSSGVISTECDPADACCDSNGNLRPHGHVCRPAESACDIEEICDPNSSRPSLCPEDLVMPGGTPCNCSNSLDPTSCTESCGVDAYKGVCGNALIQSCQGKTCQEGYECTILKGSAKCVPKEISSCQGNCGKSAATTVGCFCDDSCQDNGDCCEDYEDLCVITKGESIGSTPQWVWGVVGAVISLVVIAAIVALSVFIYKRRKSTANV